MKVLMLAALVASSQTLPTQFDLLCEGQTQYGLRPAEVSIFRYVVDTDQMKWCKNAEGMTRCPKVHPLVRVDETRYTFMESQPGEPFSTDYVDRQSGEAFSYDRRLGVKELGKCRVEPFSGFPVPKL